jgi:hypothetical protein
MTHIDWRAKHIQRPFDNIYRTVYTGTKATWVGKLNIHQ